MEFRYRPDLNFYGLDLGVSNGSHNFGILGGEISLWTLINVFINEIKSRKAPADALCSSMHKGQNYHEYHHVCYTLWQNHIFCSNKIEIFKLTHDTIFSKLTSGTKLKIEKN